jgi:hypothetical protein
VEHYSNGEVNYICDKCGRGRMISFASFLCVGSSRVLYQSKCDLEKCGYEHNMLREYPQKIEHLYYELRVEEETND